MFHEISVGDRWVETPLINSEEMEGSIIRRESNECNERETKASVSTFALESARY